MKKLAAPILVLALLGIASLFVPGPHGSLFGIYREFDGPRVTLLLLAFAGAGAAAVRAFKHVRPWQGYVALGGFALAMVKAKGWDLLQHFSTSPVQLKLHAVAIVGGLALALLATILGEDRVEATS